MAIEFARRKQNIAVVMLHPGTVNTDLSEPFQKVHTCSTPPAYLFHAGVMQPEVTLAATNLLELLLGKGLSQPFHNAQTNLLPPHLQRFPWRRTDRGVYWPVDNCMGSRLQELSLRQALV